MRENPTGWGKRGAAALLAAALSGTMLLAGCTERGGGSGGAADAGVTASKSSSDSALRSGDFSPESILESAGESGDASEQSVSDYESDASSSDANLTIIAKSDDAGETEGDGGETSQAAESKQKLVYSSRIGIETTTYDDTVAALHDLVGKGGAFFESESDAEGYGGLREFSAEIRVPVEEYEGLLSGLDGIGGKVTSRHSDVENITRVYADNEGEIEGLQTQEKRLLEMLGQADDVSDMLTIESRLSDVQTRLNQARNQREVMDSEVSLSTVSVSIEEVTVESAKPDEGYGDRASTAFQDMCQRFVEFMGDLGIGIIYAIPAIVFLAILIFLAVFFGRKAKRKLDAGTKAPSLEYGRPATPKDMRVSAAWRQQPGQVAEEPTAPGDSLAEAEPAGEGESMGSLEDDGTEEIEDYIE